MRIIHTSDWHLGRTIENRYRHDEQEEFLMQIADICKRGEKDDERRIDVVIVSGDVYDSFNPPARSEEIFYKYIQKIAGGGKRLVVIVAGNHDNPTSLAAARGLARRDGIIIAGNCTEKHPEGDVGGHKIINSDNGCMTIKLESGEKLGLMLMPFLNEQRLGESFISEIDDDGASALQYSDKVIGLMKRQRNFLTGNKDKDAKAFEEETNFLLAVAHIYASGGVVGDSERPIQIGGSYTVDATELSAVADYVALGHLHRAQQVAKNVFYSGTPLHYSKSEAGQKKYLNIIETDNKTGKFKLERHEIKVGKPIEVWKVSGVEDAVNMCRENADRRAWVYIEIDTDSALTGSEMTAVKREKKDVLSVIPSRFARQDVVYRESIEEESIEDLFREYYTEKRNRQPDDETMKIFGEIVNYGENDDEDDK